jgi:deoxycytidine triphosphate deaminase
MILSNIEIQRALEEGRLAIAPEPWPRRPENGGYCPYDTHAVDLRLYQEITVLQAGPYHYDMATRDAVGRHARHSQRFTLTEDKPYPLQPHQFILGGRLNG